MSYNKTIYLDVDNTIFPTEERFIDIYNTHYRLPDEEVRLVSEITTWNWGVELGDVKEIFSRIDFYDPSKIQVYPNLKESLAEIKKMGYTTIIYSKGTLTNIASKTMWLYSELGDLIDGHIFIGSTKNLKMGKGSVDMSGGIMIDDHIDNLTNNNAICNICARMMVQEVDWNKDFIEEKQNGKFIMTHWSQMPSMLREIESIFDKKKKATQ